MRYLRGFGSVSSEETEQAEDFFGSLTGARKTGARRATALRAEQAPLVLPGPYLPPLPMQEHGFSEGLDIAETHDEGCGCAACQNAEHEPEATTSTGGCGSCGGSSRSVEARGAYEEDDDIVEHDPLDEDLPDDDFEQDSPSTTTTSTTPAAYLPTGGRAFVPAQATFNCKPTTFTVIPASFLPQATTDTAGAITTALTAAGLSTSQRGRINTAGLIPIAAEFGPQALTELFARLRWSASSIVSWGSRADRMLVQRLLIHIPGHFRELARRAPGPAEAFVLECIGWMLMRTIRDRIKAATNTEWWIPPAPSFVTAVPNPIPSLSTEVRNLITHYGYLDTTMTPGQWNGRYSGWHTGLPGLLWNAEVNGPTPGLPFYASLVTVPAHLNTTTTRTSIGTAWTQRLADTDALHTPHAAGATTVTLAGLQNAVALRRCENSNRHLPSGGIGRLGLQGLELAYNFPMTTSRTKITRLALMSALHPIYTAVFSALHTLGWNDLVYQTSGAGCFRGIKHTAHARVTIGGSRVLVNPFSSPNATTVTRINTHFTQAQRNRVLAACRTARRMSEHGIGAAVDLNVMENGQGVAGRGFGSMDPRVVALFEAFHFRWGACFNLTDPHHFEYCRAACAPAAVSAGPAPTSTPGLIPSGAGPMRA